MSLINDALKRARQQTGTPPSSIPPAVPSLGQNSANWILPVIILFLIVAAGVLVTLSLTHKTMPPPAPMLAPAPVSANPPAKALEKPQIIPVPAPKPPPSPVHIDTPDRLPRLQGVFYDPLHPLAIVNGKTVQLGDVIGNFRVKAISKSTVTLKGPDGTNAIIHLAP